MSVLTINELKARFVSTDRPSQKDYSDWIDTMVAMIDAIALESSWNAGDAFFYAEASFTPGTPGLYQAIYSPTISAYIDGSLLVFRAATVNGAGGTNLNAGAGSVPIVKQKGLPLEAGDIQPGQFVEVRYDISNTVWRVVSALAKSNQKTGDIIISATALMADASRLLCDGSTPNVADYPELAAALVNLYGNPALFSGYGTTFNLPDYRSCFPLGAGSTLPLSGTPVPLGGTGGADEVILSAAESGVSAHTHFIVTDATDLYGGLSATKVLTEGGATSAGQYALGGLDPATNPATIGLTSAAVAAAAADAHQNMPPWIGVYYYILT